ncbi:AfsA-related hotdog domain-containing protein [Dactylosporangium sp. NPDC049525]|uniref:AfsA-related hotdog domain-containing protein n=1 Tax=Dactylosporangium sp. NPDC049525 TaxID=3154730 RepID=UPI00342B38F8
MDRKHPFFFDHPVDHLPGNLLVAGLLDLADDVTGGALRQPDRRMRLAFTFPAFGELDAPVELRCEPDGETLGLTAAQPGGAAGRDICRGTLTVTAGTPLPSAAPPGHRPAVPGRAATATLDATATLEAPAEPRLVHRADESTVMAGTLTEEGPGEFTSAVLRCPKLAEPGELRDPIEVIEAARQLILMLGHVANGHPYDSHVVWIDLEADVPTAPPGDLPLRLRWRTPSGKARPRVAFDMCLLYGSTELGTVRLVTHTMSPAAYRKLRSA